MLRIVLMAALLAFTGCQPSGPKSLLLGDKYLGQGEHGRALKHLLRAAELMPEHPEVWNRLGIAYHGTRQPARAFEAYQRALRINRALPAPHFNLGVLLLEQQRPAEAALLLRSFVGLQPDQPAGWTQLGTALLRQRKPDEAEQALNRGLRLNPKNVEILNALGVAHVQRKRPREGMQSFQNALQWQPAYGPALLNQAIVAEQYFDNKELALRKYQTILAAKPEPGTALAIQHMVDRLERELRPPAPLALPLTNSPALASAAKPPGNLPTNLPPAQTPGDPRPSALQSNVPVPAVAAVAKTPVPAPTSVSVPVPDPEQPKPSIASTQLVANAEPSRPAGTSPTPAEVTTPRDTIRPPDKVDPKPEVGVAAATTQNLSQPAASAAGTKEPKETTAAEPLEASEPSEPLAPVEVVQLPGDVEFRPALDSQERAAVSGGTPPPATASTNDNRPLVASRRKSSEEESPSFLERANPLRWFRRDPAPSQTASATPATPATPSAPATPVPGPPPEATNTPPPVPRVIPQYPHRPDQTFPKGDRAAAQQLLERGAAAHAQRRLGEASELYRAAIQADPSYFEPHYNLGLAALQSQELTLALSEGEKSVLLNPKSVDARYNFALALREAHYYLDAAAQLRALLIEAPAETRAHLALANLYSEQLAEPALARQHYLSVLELAPNHPEAPAIRLWLASRR